MGACSAGRRGEDEHVGEVGYGRWLATVGDDAGSTGAKPYAGGPLAGEGDCAWAITAHDSFETIGVEGVCGDVMVHAGAQLRHVREADAEGEQVLKLGWGEQPRRQPDLVQGAPEPVAAAGVVVPQLSRALPGGRADEHNAQVGREDVGELMVPSLTRTRKRMWCWHRSGVP